MYLWLFIIKINDVLLAGVSEVWAVAVSLVCLWCPCMSAPSGKPLWVDPCGGNIAPSGPHHDPELNPPSDSELLTGIIISAKSALDYAKQFSEAYVSILGIAVRRYLTFLGGLTSGKWTCFFFFQFNKLHIFSFIIMMVSVDDYFNLP